MGDCQGCQLFRVILSCDVESVRRAVTSTGLASVAPLEVVSQGAGDSADVQAAYRSLLRTTVQTALRDNAEFTPERFPNASTYFKTQ